MPDILFQKLQEVENEATFLVFVEALREERISVEGLPTTQDGFRGEWANSTIVEFLEAAIAWAEDSGFGDSPGPKSGNLWCLFAQFLWAGRGYE
ncbi:MAG: hypothetical protein H7Y12_07340 [Sphingobacteriaceae bacterium]|nr:hypothetical protein [Cytophagaceae bacterium]